MHHFFISPENIGERQVILTGEQARQVAQVLRMRVGERVMVLDNAGWQYEVRLTAVARQQINADIIEKRLAEGEPATHITLYMALLKREKFEWVLQKGTEVGISRFVPVITQRTLAQDTEIKASKQERWQKILTEAAEQSRRGCIPILGEPVKLAEALAQREAELAIIPWEEETAVTLQTTLAHKAPRTIALFIGPEGGFAPEEIERARQCHVQPVTLGKRILRAETAALVTAAWLVYELEEIGNPE